MEKTDIKSLYKEELETECKRLGLPKFQAKQLFQWLHEKNIEQFDECTNISKDTRNKLKEEFEIPNLRVVDKLESSIDGTCKFLFELDDHCVIESVLMKYHHGNSVCVSSQVGCRMGCKFCASTIGGLERNLKASEILGQIYQIQKISGERVSNVVIMGSGEPMDNYDQIIRFIRLLSDPDGLNISARNITVSTCGLPDRIRQLAGEGLPVTLALSLHAPNDEVRKKLLPVSLKYDIKTVLEACLYYYETTARRLTFEYSLVEGVNDEEVHAMELSRLLKGINCHVNLIPVNKIKERDFKHSTSKNILKFKNILEKNRINVTIRREMGADINAACGQLRKSYIDRLCEKG